LHGANTQQPAEDVGVEDTGGRMEGHDPEVIALASEIERYLEEHPEAADTKEHIARWWILRQRIEAGLALTQEALDYLEANGVVERTQQGLYGLAKRCGR
jgi:hypothetical protein